MIRHKLCMRLFLFSPESSTSPAKILHRPHSLCSPLFISKREGLEILALKQEGGYKKHLKKGDGGVLTKVNNSLKRGGWKSYDEFSRDQI